MNILVTLAENQYPNIVDEATRAKLNALGTVTYRHDLRGKIPEDTYSAAIGETQAEIVITCWGSPRLTARICAENPQLKYMCNLSGTVRALVEPEAIEAGLIVSNWGPAIARTVAEGALCMILGVLRRSTRYQMEMHVRKGWRVEKPTEGLFEQRVGLHGLGIIAQELVRLLEPFDCRISAFSPNCPDSVFQKLGVQRVDSLARLFAQNRIISVHASKTEKNRHIINADILAKLEDGGCIVNTARGSVIDTDALVAELKTGRIEAALDVYEKEPLERESELRGLENCLLFPHNAGPTPDRQVDMGRYGIANIERYIRGEPLESVVTARKYALIT